MTKTEESFEAYRNALARERIYGKPKFTLGIIIASGRVAKGVHPVDQEMALYRHHRGDWGGVCQENWEYNDSSLRKGFNLLSYYCDCYGVKFVITTEADRSVTRLLLPEEY
jgi:hypothetical protein